MNTKVMSFTNTAVQELESNVVQDLRNTIKFGDSHKEKVIDNIVENTEVTALVFNKKQSAFIKVINKILKRTIDIFGGLLGTIMLIPITIGIYIANKIAKDDGPIFYAHKRIGKDGKYFKMYKFRSMCVGADEKLKELLENDEEARKEWEANQKLKNDPRITKVGNFIRKTSLDEFPQFLNVLRGEMSIVGPRAVVDGEIEKFGVLKEKVLSVKPGITGYWAANGRSDTDYGERVAMEATYVDRFSIWTDIKILLKTVKSVILKEGAV